MHISEGVLSGPILLTGAGLAVGGIAIGLRSMETEEVPKVAVLSSAFFVASLIHVPIGPTNVHLILNGLTGMLLGWSAFPAILVGTALQAILFQFGGLTALGVNTFNMAFPAVLCAGLFSPLIRQKNMALACVAGGLCGALAITMSAALIGASLAFTGDSFLRVAQLTFIAHLPVMVIEGILTGFCVMFLKKVRPELLHIGEVRP